MFLDDNSISLSDGETRLNLEDVFENLPRSTVQMVDNSFFFKTPLNVVIADHKPERDFVRQLVKPENARAVDAWIKNTDQVFYHIEFGWRKGDHPKRGYFNPDFFIKKGKHVLVIEIKGDEELSEPSDENKAKYRAAKRHFSLLNEQQDECSYHFHFLTPLGYDAFFRFLRDENYEFISNLDAALNNS